MGSGTGGGECHRINQEMMLEVIRRILHFHIRVHSESSDSVRKYLKFVLLRSENASYAVFGEFYGDTGFVALNWIEPFLLGKGFL